MLNRLHDFRNIRIRSVERFSNTDELSHRIADHHGHAKSFPLFEAKPHVLIEQIGRKTEIEFPRQHAARKLICARRVTTAAGVNGRTASSPGMVLIIFTRSHGSAQRTTATCGTCRLDARRATLLFSLQYQEALIMTKHRGRGVATINYPIGMNLGGNPSQALVHSNPTGKFTVALSSIDLGQGMTRRR